MIKERVNEWKTKQCFSHNLTIRRFKPHFSHNITKRTFKSLVNKKKKKKDSRHILLFLILLVFKLPKDEPKHQADGKRKHLVTPEEFDQGLGHKRSNHSCLSPDLA